MYTHNHMYIDSCIIYILFLHLEVLYINYVPVKNWKGMMYFTVPLDILKELLAV